MRTFLCLLVLVAAKGLVLKNLRDAARRSAVDRTLQHRQVPRPPRPRIVRDDPASGRHEAQGRLPGRQGGW